MRTVSLDGVIEIVEVDGKLQMTDGTPVKGKCVGGCICRSGSQLKTLTHLKLPFRLDRVEFNAILKKEAPSVEKDDTLYDLHLYKIESFPNIMELEKKLEIFEKYNFGKKAELARAGVDIEDPKARLYHGMAAVMQGIAGDIHSITEIKEIEKFMSMEEHLQSLYTWIQFRYNRIEWDGLDSDSDFKPFYQTRGLLNKLGSHIDTFLEQARNQFPNYSPNNNYTEMEKTITHVQSMMETHRVIYKRLKSQLNPNKKLFLD